MQGRGKREKIRVKVAYRRKGWQFENILSDCLQLLQVSKVFYLGSYTAQLGPETTAVEGIDGAPTRN